MNVANFQGQFKHNQGFTLIEMMIVVAIIGILAAVAYPAMQRQLAELRVRSAKESLVAAFKDAQAQSIILRKPVWVVVEKEGSQFVVVLTDSQPSASSQQSTNNNQQPASNQPATNTTAPKILSRTSLSPTIRLVGSNGAELDETALATLKNIRVTPAGNFEIKSGNGYSTGSYNFTFCDTGYKSLKVKPVRFESRSSPISSKSNSVSEITCNLQ